MTEEWKPPTSSSTTVHNFDKMKCMASPNNSGAVDLTMKRGDPPYETFSITFFTRDPQLAMELETAINIALARRNRLAGP